jgi:hypothetical protein
MSNRRDVFCLATALESPMNSPKRLAVAAGLPTTVPHIRN